MFKKLFFIGLIWLACTPTQAQQAQYIWNDKSQQIYESITSLRIPEARQYIALERNAIPNNLVNEILESYADFYTLFLNEDFSAYQKLYPQFAYRIKLFEQGPKNTPYYKYCLGLSYLQKSIISMRFEKIWDAAWDFRKAYFMFKENKKAFPQFTPNELFFGVMTTVVGTIPKGYQWIANMLGLNGKISEGNALVLKYILANDENNKKCRNEALLIYPYLVMNFEGNTDKAFHFMETTTFDFKKNQLHAYMAANLYLNHQQSNKALTVIQQIENSDSYLPLPFWNLESGYAYLNELSFEKAQQSFTRFLARFKGKFYVKDALEKLSWIAYLQGDLKKAAVYQNEILHNGSQITDADKQAYQNAKLKYFPNPLLLKARLLSDGGFQNQALLLLNGKTSNDFSLEADKTEFAYRLGRIYDLMGQEQAAIKYYLSAIEKGENQPTYFAARAALQVGNIHEKKGQFSMAIAYYNQCIAMKEHAYKNSLDQKAKSGIQRCLK